MPDALDVIRACQRVTVWRRQTLIDENRKASRNIETRSQASGRAPFAFFCDALARILMTGSRRDSETLATIRTRLFGALALDTNPASAHRPAESMDPDCSLTVTVPVVA